MGFYFAISAIKLLEAVISMIKFFLVGFGGFFGSLARYYISTIFRKKIIATFTANITGAIVLAFTVHFYRSGLISEAIWLFIGIGFSGAYTTFSTFGHETLQLLLVNRYKIAVIYVSSSFLTALSAVFVVLYLLT